MEFAVSERDLVHLVDAKVRAARSTAARSQAVAILAQEDLEEHRRWFEQQRQETEATLQKHATRLERERAAAARRERRQEFAADVKSVGAGVRRGTTSSFAKLCMGLASVAEIVRQILTQSAELLWSGLLAVVAKARALWPPLMDALAAVLSGLAVKGRSGANLAATSAGRGEAILQDVHHTLRRHLRGTLERRSQPASGPNRARASRLVHQRLQQRISALDKAGYGRLEPVLDEWQAFRHRAEQARQHLEVRRRDGHQGMAWNGTGAFRGGTTLWRREPEMQMPDLPIVPPRPETHPPASAVAKARLNPLAAR
jgi:hypothetical protein